MNASEQADLVLGYTRSWAMFASGRPAPEDFSLPSGPCWVCPWHALAASGVARENGGDETGAEGGGRGGVTCALWSKELWAWLLPPRPWPVSFLSGAGNRKQSTGNESNAMVRTG